MEFRDFQLTETAFCKMLDGGLKPGLVNRFVASLRRTYPNQEELAQVHKFLTGLKMSPTSIGDDSTLSENDRHFAVSISQLAQRAIAPAASEERPDWSIREVGQDLDFLADTCFLPNLTSIQVVNLLFLRRITPSKPVAVVVTARDEGLYLLEWIAFYRTIGVTEIFVYTNDNADGSEELLKVLAEHGIIKLLRNHVRPGTNPQRKAYQHALHLLHELRAFKWVLFLDADEFLMLDQRYKHKIANFIDHIEAVSPDPLPGAVLFPWDWRLSDLGFKKTEGLLFERYTHSVPHFGVKSLTRIGATLGMCEVHIPTLEEGAAYVDSSLQPVEASTIWDKEFKSQEGGSIAHFWGKSFEEFAVKKRRGDLLHLECNPLFREFSQYFEWAAPLNQENYRPVPQALVNQTQQALKELKELPGVLNAMQQIDFKFAELSDKIEKEVNLIGIYEQMRADIQPALDS